VGRAARADVIIIVVVFVILAGDRHDLVIVLVVFNVDRRAGRTAIACWRTRFRRFGCGARFASFLGRARAAASAAASRAATTRAIAALLGRFPFTLRRFFLAASLLQIAIIVFGLPIVARIDGRCLGALSVIARAAGAATTATAATAASRTGFLRATFFRSARFCRLRGLGGLRRSAALATAWSIVAASRFGTSGRATARFASARFTIARPPAA
jgi:hypothetical protein